MSGDVSTRKKKKKAQGKKEEDNILLELKNAPIKEVLKAAHNDVHTKHNDVHTKHNDVHTKHNDVHTKSFAGRLCYSAVIFCLASSVLCGIFLFVNSSTDYSSKITDLTQLGGLSELLKNFQLSEIILKSDSLVPNFLGTSVPLADMRTFQSFQDFCSNLRSTMQTFSWELLETSLQYIEPWWKHSQEAVYSLLDSGNALEDGLSIGLSQDQGVNSESADKPESHAMLQKEGTQRHDGSNSNTQNIENPEVKENIEEIESIINSKELLVETENVESISVENKISLDKGDSVLMENDHENMKDNNEKTVKEIRPKIIDNFSTENNINEDPTRHTENYKNVNSEQSGPDISVKVEK